MVGKKRGRKKAPARKTKKQIKIIEKHFFVEEKKKSRPRKKRAKTIRTKKIYPQVTKELPPKAIVVQKNTRKDSEISKQIIQNTIALQKVMTSLAIKIDESTKNINSLSGKVENLSEKLNSLVMLFENSAKTLIEKGYTFETPVLNEKAIEEKLNQVINQNAILAKSVTGNSAKPSFEITKKIETNTNLHPRTIVQKTEEVSPREITKKEPEENIEENKEKKPNFWAKYQEPISTEQRSENMADI